MNGCNCKARFQVTLPHFVSFGDFSQIPGLAPLSKIVLPPSVHECADQCDASVGVLGQVGYLLSMTIVAWSWPGKHVAYHLLRISMSKPARCA